MAIKTSFRKLALACACLLSLFSLLAAMPQAVLSADAANMITVEAEGVGPNRLDALKAAWQEAVRKAVGIYMSARTEVLNDEINEKIAAYSRGQIDSFKLLSETHENDMWRVSIEARVEKDIIQEALAPGQSAEVGIDGASVAAKMQSAKDKQADALELLNPAELFNLTDCLNYQVYFQTYEGSNGPELFAQHVLRVDLKKYQQKAAEVEKVLSQLSTKKSTVTLDQQLAKAAIKILSEKDFSIKINDKIAKLAQKQPGGAWVLPIERPKCFVVQDPSIPLDGSIVEKKYKNDIFIVKNSSSAIRYTIDNLVKKLEQAIKKSGITPIYYVQFSVSNGDGFDSINQVSDKMIFAYISVEFWQENGHGTLWRKDLLMFSPALYIPGPYDGANSVPAIVLFQKIDISPDDLAGIKSLKGSYSITPADKNLQIY